MSNREYVENRIKQALKITRGHPAKARRQIIAWTYEDPKLLFGLAQPHLTGIVAHAVGRVMNKKEEPEPVPEPATSQDDGNQFGVEILKSIAGGEAAQFGFESSGGRPMKKHTASQRHIDAIKQMVGKNQSTKK